MLEVFNTRVGKSVEIDNIFGTFMERTHVMLVAIYRLISFLNKVELVVCTVMVEGWYWSLNGLRVRPTLNKCL